MARIVGLFVLCAVAVTASAAVGGDQGTPPKVTITAFPSTVTFGGNAESTPEYSGTVASSASGQSVTVEQKECGSSWWRRVAVAETQPGGSWAVEAATLQNSLVRARWRHAISTPVRVRVKPQIRLEALEGDFFQVGIVALQFFRGQGLFERFDRGAWRIVKRVAIRRGSNSYGAGISQARFAAKLPTGASVRVRLPNALTRPCYEEGISFTSRAR